MRGPGAAPTFGGDLMDGDRRAGEKAGGRVRRADLARPQQAAGRGERVSTEMELGLELEPKLRQAGGLVGGVSEM